jgi:hypothetical protein
MKQTGRIRTKIFVFDIKLVVANGGGWWRCNMENFHWNLWHRSNWKEISLKFPSSLFVRMLECALLSTPAYSG